MKISKPKDVDSYIANSSREARPILKELRRIIKSTIPDVEEKISWGLPFYRYHGELGGYAAYKNHVSFGCGGTDLQRENRKILEAKGYITGKKTIQIKFNQKVPTTAVKQILKTSQKKNDLRPAQKNKKQETWPSTQWKDWNLH